MPIRIYRSRKIVYYHSIINFVKDPIAPYLSDVLSLPNHVGYYITPDFCYYGIVNSPECQIVVGPTRFQPIGEKEARELAFKCDVDSDDYDSFIASLRRIVPMPLTSTMQMLCTMNHILNGEELSLADITIEDIKQEKLKDESEILRSEKIMTDSNDEPVHNTVSIEQAIVEIVRKGDVEALKSWAKRAPAVRAGTVAFDQLRQVKNVFITTTTIVSRAAIRGGMDENDSLSLSDSYIQKCETLTGVEGVLNLQYRMVFDYTERVHKIKNGKDSSKLVIDVSNYVQHHICEPVNIQTLADSLYLSRTYLAAKFKKESGMTLTEFYMQSKIDEAKRVLKYTDKPLSSIAGYLGFSSQSHFTNVFKKYTGKTPLEYRNKHK